jgi:RNA recognition motif-containing protein
MYLYDLPKDHVSSIKIAEAFKNKCNGVIEQKPQIRRDYFRPFYSAIVSIPDQNLYKKACEEMRYFEIQGDKPDEKFQCRALPFDNSLLGSNKEKLANNNVFYKAAANEILQYDNLETKFNQYGKIKSLKISLNPDHSQKGFAYVCFENQESATNAAQNDENTKAFEQKDNRAIMGKLVNNMYFKNIPTDMNEEQVKEIFKPFGHIKSLVVLEKEGMGKYGFVCYEDPAGQDKQYGPTCVNKALEELLNRDMGNGLKLYVRPALSKAARDQEKLADTIRYKSSKKRVNLYVKNFPNNWTEQDLTDVFSDQGKREIENVRLEKGATGNSYAFVCFKQPDACAAAKQALQNQTFDGKVLIINNYEIKEIRAMQMAELKDKTDWEKYRQQQAGGFQWNDLTSQPHLTQIIQQLLTLMNQNDQQQRPQRQYQGNRQNNYQNRNQNRHNQGGPGMMQQPRPQGMPQPGMPQP